jgi:hypothetical protein
MSALVRLPHGLMRRYLSWLERVVVAAGLSGLVYGLLSALPVYPPNWDLVILAAVFVVALWWPPIAYFLAVAAAAYPLYTLSLYVAVLFLVVALLGQRVFTHNMGALVLVLAAPWLARYNVAWVVPLLGGLWWGAAGGAWMGGLAALWGQVVAGMAGLNPDWLTRFGTAPGVAGVAQRFGQANSLETLKLILEPLAPNTTILLYHILQVLAWAAVGGIVGALADRAWTQRRRPLGGVLVAVVGACALLGAQVGLGLWLEQYTPAALAPMWPLLLASAVVVVVMASILEGVRDVLEHPLPPARRRPRRRPTRPLIAQSGGAPALVGASRSAGRGGEATRTPVPVPAQLPDWEPADEADDLIMLELD